MASCVENKFNSTDLQNAINQDPAVSYQRSDPNAYKRQFLEYMMSMAAAGHCELRHVL